MFYENISGLYGLRAVNNAVYMMDFVNKYEDQKGEIIEQTKINVVVALSK